MSGSARYCWEDQGGLCWLCEKPIRSRDATVDHVVPRAQGGTNARGNLVATHAKCNFAKGSKHPTKPKTLANMNALRAITGLDPMTQDEIAFALCPHIPWAAQK
jgi:5-methylcytosine-specific restriction endonuclease McrA